DARAASPGGRVEVFERFVTHLFVGDGAALVFAEQFFGACDDGARQAGELRGVDAVAARSDAGGDLVKKDEVASLLRDLDVQVPKSRQGLGEFGQLVVVRREERLRAQARVVVYVFED